MTGQRRTVLLTGASGVVGQAVLREAPGRPVRIVSMARPGGTPLPAGTEEVLGADLAQPRFGLDEDSYAALARDVDTVIHSAGLTEWGLPDERYKPVNVDGTRRVIDFAQRAGATVHFMSTAFVAALFTGAPHRLSDTNVTTNYVRSKLRSEQLLRDSGIRHTVFRPTNLIGDSVTGWTSRGQIVQLMSDWICRGRAPFVPVHRGNRIDVVPQDLLAKAVLRAVELGDDEGAFWVTYGDEAMDMERAVEVCAKHAATLGRTLKPVPVTDPDALDPEELRRLPPPARSYLSVLRDVSEVTRCSGGVLPTSMPELRERYGIPHVEDTDAYLRTLEYASAHLS
ncbi:MULTISPECIES: SDR family oxidoreductase [Streptomyces]|uniref:NAD-binding protein n=2 Tax=Streptomyces TaxID=1883 RepID=A0A100Y0W5_9ACTN|nr:MULTISPECIES: SDR family oxidoreductase [Streptomyces]KUH35654.1 NAD-binding protein [Streptomyces kanasensis]UUS31129.1 SDR family oxidoreductase [Streptomyces changanensis]